MSEQEPRFPITGAQVALAIALFGAPLIGGQIAVETMPLREGYLQGVLGGPELPRAAHALLGLLAVGTLGAYSLCRRVHQAPRFRVAFALVVLLGLIGASIGYSDWKWVSLQTALEWGSYAAIFYAVIAVSGRERGVRLLLGAFTAGCAVAALKGVSEYGQMRAQDPSWRIFADWVNPNALAGVLLLGLFVSIGLMLTSERLGAIIWGLAGAVIGFGIVLTQSKGGYIAVGLGAATLFGLLWVWTGARRAMLALAPLALTVVLAAGLRASAGAQSSALARVSVSGAASEQSAGFRTLLWKSAAELIRREPMGYGIGTFRYVSAKPGLTQQTQLAHNSYLQMGVETGLVGMLALIAVFGLWLVETLRCWKPLRVETNVLRAGVVAAVVASLAHSAVDSDLYYFGIGFAIFALMGLGLQLSADGSGPELVPAPLRRFVAIGICGTVAWGLIYMGAVEISKVGLRTAYERGSQDADPLGPSRLAPLDGDAFWLAAATAEPGARLKLMERAAELTPSTRNLRSLARAQEALGLYVAAARTLGRALDIDPNNLITLKQLMDLSDSSGDQPVAVQTARRIVAVEGSPYLKVPAIPELVPTETFEARLYLADRTSGPKRLELLQKAMEGYARYARLTLPQVRQAAKLGEAYAGESLADAQAKMETARKTAERLAGEYERSGMRAEAQRMRQMAQLFAAP